MKSVTVCVNVFREALLTEHGIDFSVQQARKSPFGSSELSSKLKTTVDSHSASHWMCVFPAA